MKPGIEFAGHVRIDEEGNIVDFAVCESAESLDCFLKAQKGKTTKAKRVVRFKGDKKLGLALKEILDKAINQE